MATWPSGSKASTQNLDSGTDSPRLARSDIKQNVDNVNSIIDMFNIDSPSANQVLKYNTSNARFELGTDDAGSSGDITFVGDDSTGTAVSLNETFKIAGTQNITTAVSGDTMTITGPDLSSYLTSVAFGDLTSTPTTIAGYGITDAFDGAYGSLTGTPTIPSLGDISITNSTIQSSGDTIDLDDIVRFNVGYKEDINSLTSSASISVDATVAPVHTVTLAHAATFTISNMVAGQSIMIIITQDGTGSRTGSFTSVKFPGGAPTLSTGTGDIDVISVFYDGTNYLGNIAQDFTA